MIGAVGNRQPSPCSIELAAAQSVTRCATWTANTVRSSSVHTSGKKLVVLVGQKKAVVISVKNISGRQRWSKLDECLT